MNKIKIAKTKVSIAKNFSKTVSAKRLTIGFNEKQQR